MENESRRCSLGYVLTANRESHPYKHKVLLQRRDMSKEIAIAGTVGSLKTMCITAGMFYAAKTLGYSIRACSGASGSTIGLPLLCKGLPLDGFAEVMSKADGDKILDYDMMQQGIDSFRKLIGFPRKGDKPFLGLCRGNYIHRFLKDCYKKNKCLDFEDAQIPYIVVATRLAVSESAVKAIQNNPSAAMAYSLTSNRGEVFSSGECSLPIRASIAIPLVFAPATIDGSLYVDGGVVEQWPVYSLVKKFGPYNTILCDATPDIAEEPMFSEDINNVIDVASASIYTMLRENTLQRTRQAEEMLAAKGKKLLRFKPTGIKIGMTEPEKIYHYTNVAYHQAIEFLNANESA